MLTLTVHAPDAGKRLDRFLQEQLPAYSRTRLQEWIRSGRVQVAGRPAKPSCLLRGGETVEVEPDQIKPLRAEPEPIPLEILYEDEDIVAVNKPAGMVVHAGAGCRSGTLVNALLARFEALSGVGGDLRPGIVHRLDRYTSGVILVARHDAAHRHLAEQFARRKVEKVYLALVHGVVKQDLGKVEKPITRDPVHRVRMTARLGRGRPALTEYRVLRRFQGFTLLEVRIGTGRTHQIRVHFAARGHPVVGDDLYGGAGRWRGVRDRTLREALSGVTHPLLHAARIEVPELRIDVAAPLPPDYERLLVLLSRVGIRSAP